MDCSCAAFFGELAADKSERLKSCMLSSLVRKPGSTPLRCRGVDGALMDEAALAGDNGGVPTV